MRCRSFVFYAVFSVLITLFLTCSTNIVSPYDKSNTQIYLHARSVAQVINDNAIEDSVGNVIEVGFNCNLPMYLDSVRFIYIIRNETSSRDSLFSVFKNCSSIKNSDTLWNSITFTDSGTKIITGVAYISNGKTCSDSITATIHLKPVNHKPDLQVIGQTNILVSQTCSLTVFVADVDSFQAYSYYVPKAPTGYSFTKPLFTWVPGQAGIDTVIFIVTDNGYPPMSDTATAIITVTDTVTITNHPPVWQKDTIALSGSVGNALALSLLDKCSDSDLDTLKFSLLAGTPATDSISVNTYTFTPTKADTGVFYPKIVAKDPAGLSDTVTLHITITAAAIIDSIAPVLRLLSPSQDTIVTADSCKVQVICKDASGIATLKCIVDTATFTTAKSATVDSVWFATVKGLKGGQYSTIKFVATDASSAANKDSVTVRIKYDNDNTKPVITLIAPSKDSVSTNASSYTVKLSCRDTSGIASVLGVIGTVTDTGTNDSGNVWSIRVSGLTQNVFDSIIFTATDKSIKANQAKLTLHIKYDPTMADSSGPDIKEISGPKSGDTVKSSSVTIIDSITDPSTVDSVYVIINGGTKTVLTGSSNLYAITKTLTEGLNTIVVTAKDKSTLGTKSTQTILVYYIIAPAITTQPTAQTVCTGAAVTFGVKATGTKPLSYKWYKGTDSVGSDTIYTIGSVAITDTGSYKVTVSNGSGSVTSSAVKLTVNTKSTTPTATVSSTSICSGAYDTLKIKSGTLGTGAEWVWYIDTSTSGTALTDTIVTPTATTTYYVRGEGTCGNSAWGKATITVKTTSTAPDSITAASSSVCSGSSITLSVSGGSLGTGAQWKWYTGACGGTLIDSGSSISVLPTAQTTYYVRAIGGCASTLCASKTISVNTAPSITTQPDTAIRWVQDSTRFTVAATGTSPLTYQWYKGNTAVSGATSASYKIDSITDKSVAGYYKCIVTNTCGSDTSDSAKLTVSTCIAVSAGAYHSLFLKNDSTLWACGYTSSGGTQSTPTKIMSNVKCMSAGNNASYVVKNDGTVYKFTYIDADSSQITGVSTAKSVAGNINGVLILLTTGKVYSASNTTLEDVANSSSVKSIAASLYCRFMLKTDGYVWRWGSSNYYGELGNGTRTADTVPTQYTDIKLIDTVNAGCLNSFIIRNDSLWGCGDKTYYQLGEGTNGRDSNYTYIMTGVKAVSVGGTPPSPSTYSFTLILKTDGTLFFCGYNKSTSSTVTTPTTVMENVSSASAGGMHSLVVKNDGSLWVFGTNTYGAFGDGSTTLSTSPVRIRF